MSAPSPLLHFVIGGAQKAGTTALAQYLAAHPQLRLPRAKEAHVFDAADFDEGASAAWIDARYATHFDAGNPSAAGVRFGDATPIYLFHPLLVQRIARYNPALRWIVLLRDPADRALSHYHMERARGAERWPLWPALLCERWRLRGHADDFSDASPLRTHSYRARGDYARQLDALYRAFPREQVLVLMSATLRQNPAACVAQVCHFLGVEPLSHAPQPAQVFVGDYPRPGRFSPTRCLLRWLLRRERRQLRQRYGIDFDRPVDPG